MGYKIKRILVGTNQVRPGYLYKYIRWTITANRNNIAVTQMSEFEICNNSGTKMSRPTGTTITGNITGPSGETVDKIIDGSTSTKYCPNGSLPVIITITLGEYINFNNYHTYKWYTANDASERDPVSWTIEVSSDGTNWTTVDTVTNATIPTTRYALAYTGTMVRPSSRLPSAYQEVEYIESSGTQYINTGVTVNSANRVFKLKYKINTSNNNRSVFGTLVRGTEAGPNTRFSRLDNQLEWDCYAGNGNGRITYNKAIPSGAEEYELGNNYIKDLSTGTTLVTGTASNKSRSDYIPIFGRYNSDGGYNLASLKLYYFQIIDSGTPIRDFVPCYRKSDSVIGLYDLANNTFYTNNGSGTFTKGPDVN